MTLKGFFILLICIAFLLEAWIVKLLHDIGLTGYKMAFGMIAVITLFLLLSGLFVAVFMM